MFNWKLIVYTAAAIILSGRGAHALSSATLPDVFALKAVILPYASVWKKL
jgi:hypothetical protein